MSAANDTPRRRKLYVALLVSAVLLSTVPLLAQEEDDDVAEEETGKVHVYIEAGVWVSQVSGLQDTPATSVVDADGFAAETIKVPHGTETAPRFRFGLEMKKWGLMGTWWAWGEQADVGGSSPGVYNFGQSLSHPLYAGFANDGRADGFAFGEDLQLRELRIDIYREAWSSRRSVGRWYAGYRQLDFDISQRAGYTSLVNSLPPFLPPFSDPRPDLTAGTDSVTIDSSYRGRGLEFGIEADWFVYRDRVWIESGLVGAILRGKVSNFYLSRNYYYLSSPDSQPPEILQPPYDEFDDPANLPDITQEVLSVQLSAVNESMSSFVFEGNLGVRWRAFKGLQVFAGLRMAYYADVGRILRPKVVADQNLQDVGREAISVTFEGFYGGIGYRF